MGDQVRSRILNWFHEGLQAVDPARVTRDALREIDPGSGKLIVLSVGKAAEAMATAASEVFGGQINAGVVVAKSVTDEIERFTSIQAAHPIPDEQSLRAGELTLELFKDLRAKDTVIALISGGGSSLLESPIEGISLMDMQVTTELLMYAGAGIYELNAVRQALSATKGGGLRRAIGDARCITLMLSDVVGNDHTIIASGPTVPKPTNRGQAWEVIVDFKIEQQVPETVRLALTSDAPPQPELDTSRDIRRIIADNSTLVTAVREAAERDGLRANLVVDQWRDDARELAHRIIVECRNADDDVDMLIGGGEATSVVRGDGLGGRNTETALVAALTMNPEDDWTIASLASDGDDGNSGAAGAIVSSSTVDNRTIAEAALEISDSAGYLEKRDALVVTGQTGTNVNDVYIAVRNSAFSGDET